MSDRMEHANRRLRTIRHVYRLGPSASHLRGTARSVEHEDADGRTVRGMGKERHNRRRPSVLKPAPRGRVPSPTCAPAVSSPRRYLSAGAAHSRVPAPWAFVGLTTTGMQPFPLPLKRKSRTCHVESGLCRTRSTPGGFGIGVVGRWRQESGTMRERGVVMVGLVLSARRSSPNGAPAHVGAPTPKHSSHRARVRATSGRSLQGSTRRPHRDAPCHRSARSHVWTVRRRSHAPPSRRHQRAAHHRNRTSVPA